MRSCKLLRPIAAAAASAALSAFAQTSDQPVPATTPTATIYRQVMQDGRVVYADRILPGARVDNTLAVERPIKGNIWTTESGAKPIVQPRMQRTPVQRAAVTPAPTRRMTLAEAESEVVRAEMLLEDAKKQQEAGIEPLPGERTGTASGGSRLNEAYHARQKLLAKYVKYAEETLKKALDERSKLLY